MQLLSQPLNESVIPVIWSDGQYISQLVSFKSVTQSTQSVLNIIGPLQACHQDNFQVTGKYSKWAENQTAEDFFWFYFFSIFL